MKNLIILGLLLVVCVSAMYAQNNTSFGGRAMSNGASYYTHPIYIFIYSVELGDYIYIDNPSSRATDGVFVSSSIYLEEYQNTTLYPRVKITTPYARNTVIKPNPGTRHIGVGECHFQIRLIDIEPDIGNPNKPFD